MKIRERLFFSAASYAKIIWRTTPSTTFPSKILMFRCSGTGCYNPAVPSYLRPTIDTGISCIAFVNHISRCFEIDSILCRNWEIFFFSSFFNLNNRKENYFFLSSLLFLSASLYFQMKKSIRI